LTASGIFWEEKRSKEEKREGGEEERYTGSLSTQHRHLNISPSIYGYTRRSEEEWKERRQVEEVRFLSGGDMWIG
jgi:hypothetical protein